MEKISVNVPAIHCSHCAHTIKMELSELPGIKSIEVDVDKKEINATYEQPATEQKIRDLLIEINYPPEH